MEPNSVLTLCPELDIAEPHKACWSQSPNDARRKKDSPPFNRSNIFLNNQAAKDKAAWAWGRPRRASDSLVLQRNENLRTRSDYFPLRRSNVESKVVLSSDEEEGNACPTSSSSLTPTIKCLRLHAKKTTNSRDLGTASEPSGSESQTGNTNKSSEGQFMADSIIIPLKDPKEECLSLSVVTSQLQKYGIWNQSSGEDPSETHTVIFLWVSGAQAQLIQKELSAIHPVEQPSKYSEFLFVELCSPPDEPQQQLLKELMCETGRRSEIPSLCAAVPWEEGHALLQGVSSDCPFISSWCLSQVQDLEQEESALTLTPPSTGSPQKEWTQPEPSYTLCHRRTKDTYSVSIGLRPSKHWKEHKYTGPLTKLIVFPPPPTKGGIAVTTEDVECLDNGQFLNDVIIDFYLKYLMIEKVPNNVAERTHIFSSFFYRQLTRKDTPKEGAANISAHWYLVVICFPGMEESKYEDRNNQCPRKNGERSSSEEEEGTAARGKALNGLMKGRCEKSSSSNQEKAGVDNFNLQKKNGLGHYSVVLKQCESLGYLQVEWDVKMGTPRSFTSDQMTGSNCRVPLQDNSSDCGIYLLQYVESFLQNPVVHFEFPVQLERWFPRQEVKRKRDRIRDLILQLYRQQKSSS
ncbi:Sentrin-specific protease 7 [Acipenser ruthenus]|uniref:Sentrin-specific protease 7 n=1 Tax=Acipenser ruthenus TaxID=7906 RepID=A0A444UA32_ACIRT|nr:Sentrin-specific protease 7 [Acipenser ruthenus]